MVKPPGRIAVSRRARNLGTANHKHSTAAPSQFAGALAPSLPSVLSPRPSSRLGIPGEPAVVGASSYKLRAAFAQRPKGWRVLKDGESRDIGANQGRNAAGPSLVRRHPTVTPTETTASKQPKPEDLGERRVPPASGFYTRRRWWRPKGRSCW